MATFYRHGDSGEPVRDIQDRLSALGYDLAGDPPATFGDGTRSAIVAFQEARNLAPDGLVGRETWRTIVDAGHALGDRLLYYRLPMLHGDDVARLQRNLNALGFDAGREDTIFGPDTLAALLDFQQNRHMAEDGVAGPQILKELRLMVRATQKPGRQEVRERVWLSTLPPTMVGQRIYVDPFCRDDHEAAVAWDAATAATEALRELGAAPMLSRSADTMPHERMRAARANEMAVDIILAFALPRTDDPGVFYFASALSKSEAGEALARWVASRLGLGAIGRTMPILRETRAVALVVATPHLDATTGRGVARGLDRWLKARTEESPPPDHSPSSAL